MKCQLNPLLVVGLLLNTLRLLLEQFEFAPALKYRAAWEFFSGMAMGIMLLGALLTLLSPEVTQHLQQWKQNLLGR